jgi:outer membrane protein
MTTRSAMTRSIVLASLAAIAWPALGRAQPAPAAQPALAPGDPPAPAPGDPPVADTRPASSGQPAADAATRLDVSAPDVRPATHRCTLRVICGFYLVAGGAIVKPLSSSREMELADVDGPASLAVKNGPIAGSGATITSATIPALIAGIVLPTASRRWSAELLLGAPPTVKFRATGTLANMSIAPTALGIPTGVQALGPELGEATAAPVVLTAVYQLINQGRFRPYVGGGPAVLVALNPKVTNPTLTELTKPEMSIAPAPGLVLQGGLEARLGQRFFARLDVKFIALMQARAEVHHIDVRTPDLPLFDNVEVGTAKMNVWVNPLIVQAGIGYNFF